MVGVLRILHCPLAASQASARHAICLEQIRNVLQDGDISWDMNPTNLDVVLYRVRREEYIDYLVLRLLKWPLDTGVILQS